MPALQKTVISFLKRFLTAMHSDKMYIGIFFVIVNFRHPNILHPAARVFEARTTYLTIQILQSRLTFGERVEQSVRGVKLLLGVRATSQARVIIPSRGYGPAKV